MPLALDISIPMCFTDKSISHMNLNTHMHEPQHSIPNDGRQHTDASEHAGPLLKSTLSFDLINRVSELKSLPQKPTGLMSGIGAKVATVVTLTSPLLTPVSRCVQTFCVSPASTLRGFVYTKLCNWIHVFQPCCPKSFLTHARCRNSVKRSPYLMQPQPFKHRCSKGLSKHDNSHVLAPDAASTSCRGVWSDTPRTSHPTLCRH